jgi:hypothetical protein
MPYLREVKGISVFSGEITPELSSQYERVKVYDLTQGGRGINFIYYGKKTNQNDVKTIGQTRAKRMAEEDSESKRLENKMVRLALERTVETALKENEKFGLGIELIADPNIYWSESKIRNVKNPKGYQADLTIKLNITGYKKR